jgi:hypothetical protein
MAPDARQALGGRGDFRLAFVLARVLSEKIRDGIQEGQGHERAFTLLHSMVLLHMAELPLPLGHGL